MVAVHYNNEHFLLNGVDVNQVVSTTDSSGNTVNPPDSTSTARHGMAVNTSAPTMSETGGSGTGFTITSSSTLIYWIEERVKVGSLVTKRNASSSDETVTITGDGTTTYKPLVTRPTTVNSEATHWALFRTATDGSFPTGAEISEVAIATTTIEDTNETNDPAIPSGSTYELWVASQFGAVISVPRNGVPPIATTGDVFEDSVVTNDVSDERAIRYSWPDKPHQWPTQQRIPFETKEHDEVVLIRRMGSILMVALRDSLWRVNILPRPEDASFDVARIKEQVEGAFGCVGPYAGTTFSFGRGLRFAYVSTSGIVMANEAEWDILTDDINWDKHIEISKLSQSILVDNPQEFRLEFDYTPKGEETNTKAFFLYYHPTHLKGGGRPKMKVSGPINRKSASTFVATLDSEKRIFTSNVGKLWLEGGAITDGSGGTISAVARTGDIFPVGVGGEAKAETIWVHHQASDNASDTATGYMNQRNEGDDDVEERKSFSLERREHTQLPMTGQAEAYQFGVEQNTDGSPMSVDYLAVSFDRLGESEEG
jgi:hypothetical protein